MAHSDNQLQTDIPYIHNDRLPFWIVLISGWGSDSVEKAYKRMQSYKNVAAKWGINIEFSSRLGTFNSYKKAPTVAAEIREHNEKTFAAYVELFGVDWRSTFIKEVGVED